MYQYTATSPDGKQAILALNTSDPNTVTQLDLSGEAEIDLKYALQDGYGAFGHSFDVEATTAIDLDYALNQLDGWKIESTGTHQVTSYDPGIPAEAQT